MRYLMIALMFGMSACEMNNPNDAKFMHGSAEGYGAWYILNTATPPAIIDTYLIGFNGLTDTACAYNWSYGDIPLTGTTEVKVTASNNAAGCLSIGTFQCSFTPDTEDGVNSLPHAISIACTGQITIHVTR